MSLTGDPRTDAVIPTAYQLIDAVRREDTAKIAQLMNSTRDGRALVIVLAAMVPDDQDPSVLLAWLRDPAEYRRLRDAGVSSYAAGNVLRPGKGMAA